MSAESAPDVRSTRRSPTPGARSARRSPALGAVRLMGPQVGTAVLWGAVLGLLVAGLSPLARAPLIGDDLPDLLAGWALLRESPQAFLAAGWAEQRASGHVAPVGIGLGLLHTVLAVAIAEVRGSSPSDGWAAMRVVWVASAVAAAAWAVLAWVRPRRLAHLSAGRRFAVAVAVVGAVTVATLHIHPPSPGTSPALVYPVVCWASTALAFAYLALLARCCQPGCARWWGPVTGGVGLLAVLTYAAQFAVLAPALLLAVVLPWVHGRRPPPASTRWWALTPLLVGLLGYIVLLLTQTSEYSGTQPGSAATALAVLPARLASSVPFIWAVAPGGLTLTAATLVAPVCVAGLLTLAWAVARSGAPAGLPGLGTPGATDSSTTRAVGYAAAMVGFWAAVTGLLATSARHQGELGTSPVAVYTYYAPAMLAIASAGALLPLLTLGSRGRLRVLTFTVVSLVLVGAALLQGARNTSTVDVLRGGVSSPGQQLSAGGAAAARSG